MPISCDIPISVLNQDEFGEIAFDVMHHAFAIHNEMGRFFDEPVYQAELARRLGDRACTEVFVRATFRDFEKPYRLDLLVEGGAIFELKVVGQLHDQHRAQLIHYLMMTGAKHGKLINFRPEQVEQEIEIVSQGQEIGRQTARLVGSTTAFKLTALSRDLDDFESHTRRFLNHTKLQHVLWINITLKKVTFSTVSRE